MGQTLSSNAGELRRVYSDDVVDKAVALYSKSIDWLDGTKREDGDIGEAAYWQFQTTYNWGVAPTGEGEAFSTAGTSSSINPYFVLGQLQGSVNYSLLYKEMARGRGVYGGADDGVKNLTKTLMKSILTLADIYFSGCAGDGVLGTVEATTSTSTSFVASLPYGVIPFQLGMPLQIHDDSSTEREDYARITKIVHSTRTITLDTSQNLTAADKVYFSRGTSLGTRGISNLLNGLENLVDDTGTVHNINRATYEDWKANVFGNGGVLRNYSDEYIHEALAVTSSRTKADAVVDHLISNEGMLKKYNDSKRSDIRFPIANGDASGINSGVNLKPVFHYGDRSIPWITFRHVKPRKIFGVSKANFKRYGWARPKWLGNGDPELALNSTGGRLTAEEVFLYWPLQFIGRKFNDMFVCEDFSDPIHCGSIVGGTDA